MSGCLAEESSFNNAMRDLIPYLVVKEEPLARNSAPLKLTVDTPGYTGYTETCRKHPGRLRGIWLGRYRDRGQDLGARLPRRISRTWPDLGGRFGNRLRRCRHKSRACV